MSEIAEKEAIREVNDGFVVKRESGEGENVFRVTVRGASGGERIFKIFATSRSNKILKSRGKGSRGQYEVSVSEK